MEKEIKSENLSPWEFYWVFVRVMSRGPWHWEGRKSLMGFRKAKEIENFVRKTLEEVSKNKENNIQSKNNQDLHNFPLKRSSTLTLTVHKIVTQNFHR